MSLGILAVVAGSAGLEIDNLPRFVCYLIATVATSAWKARLPGVDGNMSMNFVLLLVAVATMKTGEAVLIGVAAALFQTYYRSGSKPGTIKTWFNISTLVLAVWVASSVYHSPFSEWAGSVALRLPLAATAYFMMNTALVATVIALIEKASPVQLWRQNYLWSYPHYVVGAALACAVYLVDRFAGWEFSMLLVPSFYLLHRSYRLYTERIETERQHNEAVHRVQLRTIQALALAIEAKDQTTGDHLRRVQTYAMEIGRDLGLDETYLEALQAGALLHDIGKAGVPEYIISKPGKLTPEEFEIMKTHTIIGAEILEQVEFPGPVVPIVRGHHERWDGSGYPDGLSGEGIPIGARIVAAVDTLDALASDRQYRRAMPLEDAVAYVVKEGGRSFDPRVTEVIGRKYRQMEAINQSTPALKSLSVGIKIERGLAPAAGFEESAGESFRQSLERLATATEGAERLLDLARQNGIELEPAEAAALVCTRLRGIIAHDAIVVWRLLGGAVEPIHASGVDAALFESLRIPRGEGLSGWVVENGRAILNGNPAVETSYLGDGSKVSELKSAISAPLDNENGTFGAITLYRLGSDAFTRDHLPALTSIAAKLARLLENRPVAV